MTPFARAMTGKDILAEILKRTDRSRRWLVAEVRGWTRSVSSRDGAPARSKRKPHFHRLRPVPRALRRDLPRRLQEFADELAGNYGQRDREFIELGRALRNVYSTAESVARLVGERMGAVRDALKESRIDGEDGMAAGFLRDLQAGLTEASEELAALQSIAGELRRLRTEVRSIHRIGVSVHASVFGFAVETARTAEGQDMFGGFVSELRILAEKITRTAEKIGDGASQTQQTQEREWKTMSAGHVELSELARSLETSAVATASAVQALLDNSLAALREAEERMAEITRFAGEAVYYLQFGDIMRQKAEHVCSALHEAAEQLRTAPSHHAFRTRAAAVNRVLAIQIGQLGLTRTEIETAQKNLGKSFHSLGQETVELKKNLRQWQERSTGEPGGGNSLAAFKAEARRMELLQNRGRELRLNARQAARQAIEASAKLAIHLEQVKAINTDVHLQALNAIVKTAALGDQGTTLSVLSQHVDWLYRESHAAVLEVVAVLEAILAKANQTTPSNTPANSSHQHTTAGGIERIDGAYEACRNTSSLAHQLIEEQQAVLDGSRAFLSSLAGQIPIIDRQIQELISFRRRLSPWVISDRKSSDATVETATERYTMDSERAIHERIDHEAIEASHGGHVALPSGKVELFDTSLPTRNDSVAAPVLINPGRNGSAAAAESPEKAALGDNVELF